MILNTKRASREVLHAHSVGAEKGGSTPPALSQVSAMVPAKIRSDLNMYCKRSGMKKGAVVAEGIRRELLRREAM